MTTTQRIQILSGQGLHLTQPAAEMISLPIVATALARLCRFGGHCRATYSVGEHSVRVAELLIDQGCDGATVLAGLLHDAHECLWGFGDISRPARRSLPQEFQALLAERQMLMDRAVAKRFGFNPWLFRSQAVVQADDILLATEARDLMTPDPDLWGPLWFPLAAAIVPLGEEAAREKFLDLGRRLLGPTERMPTR